MRKTRRLLGWFVAGVTCLVGGSLLVAASCFHAVPHTPYFLLNPLPPASYFARLEAQPFADEWHSVTGCIALAETAVASLEVSLHARTSSGLPVLLSTERLADQGHFCLPVPSGFRDYHLHVLDTGRTIFDFSLPTAFSADTELGTLAIPAPAAIVLRSDDRALTVSHCTETGSVLVNTPDLLEIAPQQPLRMQVPSGRQWLSLGTAGLWWCDAPPHETVTHALPSLQTRSLVWDVPSYWPRPAAILVLSLEASDRGALNFHHVLATAPSSVDTAFSCLLPQRKAAALCLSADSQGRLYLLCQEVLPDGPSTVIRAPSRVARHRIEADATAPHPVGAIVKLALAVATIGDVNVAMPGSTNLEIYRGHLFPGQPLEVCIAGDLSCLWLVDRQPTSIELSAIMPSHVIVTSPRTATRGRDEKER